MRVYLASDHAGLELKSALVAWLGEAGHEAVDCGPAAYDPDDDYPVYVLRAAAGRRRRSGQPRHRDRRFGQRRADRRQQGAGRPRRARLDDETAQLARQHNDANVLSLGARMYSTEDAVEFAKVFVATPFSGEARHARRLAEIADFEKTGDLPPLPS